MHRPLRTPTPPPAPPSPTCGQGEAGASRCLRLRCKPFARFSSPANPSNGGLNLLAEGRVVARINTSILHTAAPLLFSAAAGRSVLGHTRRSPGGQGCDFVYSAACGILACQPVLPAATPAVVQKVRFILDLAKGITKEPTKMS
ncbi:hypothetical protein E2C01_016804 [Portunus trituberculatus]|uniref:Uncharacterized protein n=1 Tax=Portunus trituberculatus TaxID=210409 RepID=A0A5B7DQ16_PORTR|nr:hypothetical protein [Portunus trituberculatus]